MDGDHQHSTSRRLYEAVRECGEADLSMQVVWDCLARGADILYTPDPATLHSTLQQLAVKGHREALKACLAARLGYLPPKHGEEEEDGISIVAPHIPQHCPIFSGKMDKMLGVICRLVREYSEGDAAWAREWTMCQEELMNDLAANQLLSEVWPLMWRLAPCPLPSSGESDEAGNTRMALDMAWSWDWENLPEEDRARVELNAGSILLHASRSTGRLWEIAHHRLPTPPIDQLRACVREGADIFFSRDPMEEQCILCQLVSHCHVEAFMACIESCGALHFASKCGRNAETVLHCIASTTCLRASEAAAMVRAICGHIERHPGDRVEWGAENAHRKTFLDLVSQHQLLSTVWPIVRDMPYYADETAPIPLPVVWEWDWEMLGEEDQSFFSLSTSAIGGSAATARLCKVANSTSATGSSFSVAEVMACVREGADVNARPSTLRASPLTAFFNAKLIPLCLSCLRQSTRGIDFTTVALFPGIDSTFLHCIAGIGMRVTLEERQAVLHGVIDHLSAHPHDARIDWGATDLYGQTCLSAAAGFGWLSGWWDVVKKRQVSYFLDRGVENPIEITMTVRAADWDRVKEEDRLRFRLRKGIETTAHHG